MRFWFSLAVLIACPLALRADPSELHPLRVKGLAHGYVVPASSVSPDHRYGIAMYDNTGGNGEPKDDQGPNQIIELKTGRVVGDIVGEAAWVRMPHGEYIPPKWSEDSTSVVWTVDGKWFPDGVTLVKLARGKIAWQRNVLKAGQEAILSRTRRAAPEQYRLKKAENAGNGSAYPEGFSVEVTVAQESRSLLGEEDPSPAKPEKFVSFPLAVHVSLTSDPKEVAGRSFNLESTLEAVVDADGHFKVEDFRLLRKGKPLPR